MKPEFFDLQSGPLIYFLKHSSVFVTVLGVLFFFLGLWFGKRVWGRYKMQARMLREESEGHRHDIANLKRKLAEQTVRPGTGSLQGLPAAAPQPLLPEVLPGGGEILPERARAAAPASDPGADSAFAKEPPVPPASAPALAPTPPSPPAALPSHPPATLSPSDSFLMEPISFPGLASLPEIPEESPGMSLAAMASRLGGGRTRAKKDPYGSPPPSPAEDAPYEPFGFLLEDEPGGVTGLGALPPSALSALQSIVGARGTDASAEAAAATGSAATSAPPSKPVPAHKHTADLDLPPVVILPEPDPVLGLVYKEVPPQANDLTQIKGIAGQVEKRLHELGVHTWLQIAAWNDDHIKAFSARLAFKDRIVKERWVEQARDLVANT